MSTQDTGVETTVEETTNPDAPQDDVNTGNSELGADESKTTEEPKVDYAAMLEAERAKRQEAEDARKKAEEKIVKLKREKKADTSNKEESKAETPDLEALLDSRLSKLREELKTESKKDKIESIIQRVSQDPNEQELLRMTYEEKVQKSGFTDEAIMDDVLMAKMWVNRSTILKENRELAEALKAKSTLSGGAMTGSKPMTRDPEPELSEKDRALLERFGAMERYKKSLK